MTSPGLYVHIPFCRSRCSYCTFVSGDYSAEIADAYIAALAEELRARSVFSEGCRPSTMFIGGGTPSILTERQLEALFAILPRSLEETTCELNPDSVNKQKLQILRAHGVNRLSFGVQTFDPDGLRLLGRPHTAEMAGQALALAREAGFDNINLDLINNWPGQTIAVIENDIKNALRYNIQHVSYYSMILEPSSRGFSLLKSLMPQDEESDEREGEFWCFIEEMLDKSGICHYETSNYALPGFQCRHNVAIWKGGEYLGVGVAAHSHLGRRRFANTDDVGKYLKCSKNPVEIEAYSEVSTGLEKARECAVFWLRLFEGIDPEEYFGRTGFTLEQVYGETLDSLLRAGFLEWTANRKRLRVPPHYQPVLDSILVELI